jgi:MarR family transcriptional regulator, organic hydroperoxide resistance regulator
MFHSHPDSLNHLFSQIIRLHFHHFHSLLEPLGLYPGQPPLLFALEREKGLKQKELARRMHIQPATLTVMLKRMEGAGLIERKQDADDHRVSRVYLTGQGTEACHRVREVVNNMEEDIFGGMSPEEREELRGKLLIVRNRILELHGKNDPCSVLS